MDLLDLYHKHEEEVYKFAKKLGIHYAKKKAMKTPNGYMDSMVANVLGDDLIDKIKTHAKVVSYAGLSDGIPFGSGIALTAVVASTWKMYYDISNLLELPLTENFVKSISSGIISNLVSNGLGLGLHAASEIANKIPLVGSLVAAGGGAIANRLTLYAAAAMYLNTLVLLSETGTDINEDSMKRALNDSLGNISEHRNLKDLPFSTIGVLGHVDHGKTTLTSAICKVMADEGHNSLSVCDYSDLDCTYEEMERGITINSHVWDCESKNRHWTFIDCPGHADYVDNMLNSCYNMDGAIIVVSALHGPMPQTREHIILARQSDVKKIVVFINMCDCIKDKEMLELVEMDMTELLEKYGYYNVPIIFGSALGVLNGQREWNKSIITLVETLESWINPINININNDFIFNVHKVYDRPYVGTVVTGKILQGRIRCGDHVKVGGYGKVRDAVVYNIQIDDIDVDFAT